MVPPSGHIAYRCTECDLNWPRLEAYRSCPCCLGETWPSGMRVHAPMSGFDASALARQAERKRRSALRDRERMVAETMAEIEALPVAPAGSMRQQTEGD